MGIMVWVSWVLYLSTAVFVLYLLFRYEKTEDRMGPKNKSNVDIEDPIGEAMSPGELDAYTHEAGLGESLKAYMDEGIHRYTAEVAQGATLEGYIERDIKEYTDTSGYAEAAESYDGPDVQPDYRAPGEEHEVEVAVEVGEEPEERPEANADSEN